MTVHGRHSLFLAFLFGTASLPAAFAQGVSAQGDIRFSLLDVQGLIVGTTLTIDEAFGAEHGVAVNAPFSFLAPTAEDVLELSDPAPGGDSFIKINFATEDRQLIENIQFVPMTLPLGDGDVRFQTLATLLSEQVFEMAVRQHSGVTRDVLRRTTVGGYDAVEVIGSYQDAELGLMYMRIVGIPNPYSDFGVFTVANVVASKLELSGPDDFPRTRGGVALEHFEYLE